MTSTNRPAVSWEFFVAAVDQALARGYAYGRIDERTADSGPLVTSRQFLAAVRERGADVGEFPELYEQLQALNATRTEAA